MSVSLREEAPANEALKMALFTSCPSFECSNLQPGAPQAYQRTLDPVMRKSPFANSALDFSLVIAKKVGSAGALVCTFGLQLCSVNAQLEEVAALLPLLFHVVLTLTHFCVC